MKKSERLGHYFIDEYTRTKTIEVFFEIVSYLHMIYKQKFILEKCENFLLITKKRNRRINTDIMYKKLKREDIKIQV